MGIYGETAVAVVAAFDNCNKLNPKECWEYSITHFTDSKESPKRDVQNLLFLVCVRMVM